MWAPVARNIETNLDLTFDSVTARNVRIVGDDRVLRYAIRAGVNLLDRILSRCGCAHEKCRS